MAYNNYYPMGYQPIYPMQTNTVNNQTNTQSSLIWVQGEAGAKSYLVAPNQTVQLWDSESQTIYLKSADASGMPNIKILDYTVRETASHNGPREAQEEFAKQSDIDSIREEIEALRAKIEASERSKK